jgi:hypothetical protein
MAATTERMVDCITKEDAVVKVVFGKDDADSGSD